MISHELDQIDLGIIKELEVDGRMPLSELAKKLGLSRQSAGRRLHSLMDRKLVTINAFTKPRALGYRTVALTGLRVSPGSLYPVADQLATLPNVIFVVTTTGHNDIIMFSMFADATDLTAFLVREVGSIPGVISNETMITLDWWVCRSFLSSPRWELFFSSPELQPADVRHDEYDVPEQAEEEEPGFRVDRIDLAILNELEQAPKAPISTMARKVGISRPSATSRLSRLMNEGITRVVGYDVPRLMGYPIVAMIGMKALPSDTNAVLEKVRSLPGVYWVARLAGRYDLFALTVWQDPADLSRFLGTHLGTIPGIRHIEPAIFMDTRKMKFAHIVSSHLEAVRSRQGRSLAC